MMPKGMTVRTIQNKLPPLRAIGVVVLRTRFLFFVFLSAFIIILWRGFGSSASDMQR